MYVFVISPIPKSEILNIKILNQCGIQKMVERWERNWWNARNRVFTVQEEVLGTIWNCFMLFQKRRNKEPCLSVSKKSKKKCLTFFWYSPTYQYCKLTADICYENQDIKRLKMWDIRFISAIILIGLIFDLLARYLQSKGFDYQRYTGVLLDWSIWQEPD